MDQMSAAEFYELIILVEASIDSQFEFWLTITFATLVASFFAEHRLTRSLRLAVSCAYLLATVVLMSRWYYDAMKLVELVAELQNQYAAFSFPLVTAISRTVLLTTGSIATVYYIWFGFGTSGERERDT